ncbi:putative nucleic acid-binding protein [Opitutaceae bacterium TAV1]|nr:putative nucleic acid-binding protein [Opitutaceae bacterium TAV1]
MSSRLHGNSRFTAPAWTHRSGLRCGAKGGRAGEIPRSPYRSKPGSVETAVVQRRGDDLNRDDLCLCGFVLTEVLQGIRDEKQYVAVKRQFSDLLYLPDDASTFELGATIYRNLRRQGITIRNSIDCLIAATVVQHGVGLLENDRDYEFIGQHYPLNRWTV